MATKVVELRARLLADYQALVQVATMGLELARERHLAMAQVPSFASAMDSARWMERAWAEHLEKVKELALCGAQDLFLATTKALAASRGQGDSLDRARSQEG